MISTKNKVMTPSERKEKVGKLREEHEDYFQTIGNIKALYIPKMAYRPSGKDELFVSFFPSELEKGIDIYTEFVSINYESEDPKRTLYLHKYNAHWKEEYELITSNSGFERHLIPVSELQIINDVTDRREESKSIFNLEELPNPDDQKDPMVKALNRIALALEKIANK
tara:strand:- start:4416 stop:4919 length:504 start_codon:yes stop_codon:yes gene_type:complete